jgi:Timeless protein
MLELLVTIASSSNHPDFAEWNVIVMQIMFYLLKGSDPTVIASADSKDVSKKKKRCFQCFIQYQQRLQWS